MFHNTQVWEWVRVGALDWLAGVTGTGGDMLKVTDAGEGATRWEAQARIAGVWHRLGAWPDRATAQGFAQAVVESAYEAAVASFGIGAPLAVAS
jgi:hypothetical protein